MKYLTYLAARDFLDAVKLSHITGLTTWTETLDRLVALQQMCSPRNPSGLAASRILQLEEWPFDQRWFNEEQSGEQASVTSTGEITSSSLRPMKFPRGLDDEDDEPQNLCFVAGSEIGMKDWEFHQYDPDPYPSVPHGHWQGKPRPKVDPYQGWVYMGTRQIKRVEQRKIIALWNDQKFREFALEAIQYYLEHFPKFGGWRIANPLRLPRRR